MACITHYWSALNIYQKLMAICKIDKKWEKELIETRMKQLTNAMG